MPAFDGDAERGPSVKSLATPDGAADPELGVVGVVGYVPADLEATSR